MMTDEETPLPENLQTLQDVLAKAAREVIAAAGWTVEEDRGFWLNERTLLLSRDGERCWLTLAGTVLPFTEPEIGSTVEIADQNWVRRATVLNVFPGFIQTRWTSPAGNTFDVTRMAGEYRIPRG